MENKVNDDRRRLQLDGNKLLHHLDRVTDWIEGKEVYPIYVAFSPSSMCNHKCQFCVYHYKEFKPIYFPLERYRSLMSELKDLGVRSLFFAGDGEPLLNKDAVEMISITKELGIDIAINTNGRLLKPQTNDVLVEALEWMRVSLNAGTRDSYATIHGTSPKDFDIVINNLKDLVKKKKERNSAITIGVQCVLLEENKHEIAELAKLLKEIGVDYFAVKPFLQHPDIKYSTKLENKRETLKELSKLEFLSDDNFEFVLRENNFAPPESRTYKRCLSGKFMIEIDAYGDVYSCGPYIGNSNHKYGNILKQSFSDMWKSDECKKTMDYVQNKLCVSECMPHCRPDSVNKFLWEIKNPPDHVNYI